MSLLPQNKMNYKRHTNKNVEAYVFANYKIDLHNIRL